MDKKSNYMAVKLTQNLVNDIKSFEESLSKQTHKNVIVIAYEKDENQVEG